MSEEYRNYLRWKMTNENRPTERRGRWIEHQDGRWIYAKCSVCETIHNTQTNYCPNCGASMVNEDA